MDSVVLPWTSACRHPHIYAMEPFLGDKFGKSLGGSQAPPNFWKGPRTSPEVPRTSPEVFGDFPGSSLTVELNSNPEVPRKFPRLPRKFPGLPRRFPGLPGRFPVSLGSLTPSSDSQEVSLNSEGNRFPTLIHRRCRKCPHWIEILEAYH